jgi:putative ABC transport system permease protein
MDTIWQDLKFAARTLRNNPGFAGSAVVSLALGIACNTTIFSAINAVILDSQPLRAFPDPSRVVMVWEKNPAIGGFLAERVPVALRNYLVWKHQARSFDGMAVYGSMTFNLAAGAEASSRRPEQIEGAKCSIDFFPLFKVKPRLGRNFTQADLRASGQVALISDELYGSRFSGRPDILGQSIIANGKPYMVIGVLPPHFKLPSMWEGFDRKDPQVWIPLDTLSAPGEDRGYFVYATLRPGHSLEQARAELAVIAEGSRSAYPQFNAGFSVNVFTVVAEDVSPRLRRTLTILQAAVGFVLLIACANVANLLLTRAVQRRREIALRLALGAGRWRIIRQITTESLLLSAAATAAGLALSFVVISVVSAIAPADTHGLHELCIDVKVLGFTAAIAVITGMLFGLAPAVHAAGQNLNEAFRSASRSVASGSSPIRSTLVVIEVGLSVMLLIGAGLTIRSLSALLAVDPGFQLAHLLKMRLTLPDSRYSEKQAAAFNDRLLRLVRELPGVRAASLAHGVPMQDISFAPYRAEGRQARSGADPNAMISLVSDGYFETLGMKLLRGRTFVQRDTDASIKPTPVVVNETFVRLNWPGDSGLGRTLLVPADGEGRCQIVGVVGDSHQTGPDEKTQPEFFIPTGRLSSEILLVRTAGDARAMLQPVVNAVWSIDKDQPVFGIGTMEGVLREWTAQRRFTMMVLSAFAAVALLLAAGGLYSVLAYSVSLRTHELGIRTALGADSGSITSLVVGQGLRLALTGVGIGLAGAAGVNRLMQSLVFDVSPTDPYTWVAVTVVLIAVGATASYVPARRAAAVDPIEALRVE